jgi:DNA-binding transcriptional LysR family regulator
MAIRTKNLNLIPILQALLKHESVARAALEVGLSQPAMSGSLARLRDLLGDELLVRVGRSMRRTPRATKLQVQLDDVCAQIEQLFQPETFDPAIAKKAFNIATPDYIAFLLTDALMERLDREAPGIEFHFHDIPPPSVNIVEQLETGKIDLLVCANFGHWPELNRESLFTERYVVAASAGHPLLEQDEASLADLQSYPNAAVSYSSNLSNSTSTRWRSGIPAIDSVSQISSMSQFNTILNALRPGAIARTPATLAWRLGHTLQLQFIELGEASSSFDTCMFWTSITDGALEHRWLRSIIRDALSPYDSVDLNAKMQAVPNSVQV